MCFMTHFILQPSNLIGGEIAEVGLLDKQKPKMSLMTGFISNRAASVFGSRKAPVDSEGFDSLIIIGVDFFFLIVFRCLELWTIFRPTRQEQKPNTLTVFKHGFLKNSTVLNLLDSRRSGVAVE